MKISNELMKGSTVTLILSLLEERDMYGYQMVKQMETRSRGLFQLKEGTMYPILHSLETDKRVESYWLEHEGRKRKYYRLTQAGRNYLASKKREWFQFRDTMDLVIGADT